MTLPYERHGKCITLAPIFPISSLNSMTPAEIPSEQRKKTTNRTKSISTSINATVQISRWIGFAHFGRTEAVIRIFSEDTHSPLSLRMYVGPKHYGHVSTRNGLMYEHNLVFCCVQKRDYMWCGPIHAELNATYGENKKTHDRKSIYVLYLFFWVLL